MKKLLLTFALAAACTAGVSAQSYLLDNPANKGYFGIRASGEVSCPGKVGDDHKVSLFKNGGGFEVGAIYNLPVVANFYFEPGLKLYYNTYGFKDAEIQILDKVSDGASVRKFGMRVPFNFGYHFDFTPEWKVYVFTGPELEIGFTAKDHFNVKNGDDVSFDAYDQEGFPLHRFDCLWGFGAGVSYNRVYFGVSGAVGLCNMADNDTDVTFHENRVSFTLGYNF